MIKAIIFDCFDVLVGSDTKLLIDKYLGDDKIKLETWASIENRANAGELSYQQLVKELAGLAGISKSKVLQYLDNNPVNLELVNYIAKQLKPHYKIGLLSNASDDWMDEFFTSDQQDLFDDIVLSFRHNLIKPDPRIYLLAAKRLNLEPAECIFIDDKFSYCEGARSAGMQTICYSSSLAKLTQQLEKLLLESNH